MTKILEYKRLLMSDLLRVIIIVFNLEIEQRNSIDLFSKRALKSRAGFVF
jgi:hypothetical protein